MLWEECKPILYSRSSFNVRFLSERCCPIIFYDYSFKITAIAVKKQ